MKTIRSLCFLMLALALPARAATPPLVTVMADTNGVLAAPTNFFRANSNALNAAVSAAGQPPSANLTNWSTLSTNVLAAAGQPPSANLTNWSALDTNVLSAAVTNISPGGNVTVTWAGKTATISATDAPKFDANRSYDIMLASGATGADTNANGYWYRYGANNYSNSIFGLPTGDADSAGFVFTNANSWWLVATNTSYYVSNNAGVLQWHGSRGTVRFPSTAFPWGNKLNMNGLYFAFGTKDAASNAGPSFSSGYNATTGGGGSSINPTNYAKILVFDGDSRLSGWPGYENAGNTYLTKMIMGYPFFNNCYMTNFAVGGQNSGDVSNRYASMVYPLRPRTNQVGYYVVWTGANGDSPTTPAAVLQPLFKQAKLDGWTVVAICNPPLWAYVGTGAGKTNDYGYTEYLKNIALRKLNVTDSAGYWDILIDLEKCFPSMHDDDMSSDGLHVARQGAQARLADYIAFRIKEGTMTDSLGFNVIPPLAIGTYATYGITNVVLRTHPQYGNFLTKGAPFIAGDSLGGMTNDPAIWPAIPQSPGAYAIVNSNGTPFLLTSLPNSQTWNATNPVALDAAGNFVHAGTNVISSAGSLINNVGLTNGTVTATNADLGDATVTALSLPYTNEVLVAGAAGAVAGTNGLSASLLAYYPSTFASATNTLTLADGYSTLVVGTDVSITNLAGIVSGRAAWQTLQISNSAASSITARMLVGATVRAQGTGTTNGLIIPAAKMGYVSFLAMGATNFVTTVEQ